ncbi:hypothetical protein HGRIS_006800 [Hohenbuehelia grisea]|uniref:Uncharacterized protein n=1 Tax=Hohenbuehelia grisea TaxID=104357 RepID=A0ABR3JB77_9AGAR
MESFNSREAVLDQIRPAQIRVIFTLPPQFGLPSHPLAYVEWFTPLRRFDKDVGMFAVQRSTRNHQRNAAIVRVEQLVRNCHLIPKFGQAVPSLWSTDTVLEQCGSFFVNPYFDVDTFTYFRLI